jgi:Flp pilus assembly protein TadD
VGRGTTYASKGNWDKAIADFTEAIRLDPQCARAYGGRGFAYEQKGETSKAEADFAEAKRLGFKSQ